MSKAIKIISALFVVVVALGAAGIAILSNMDFNQYRGLIAQEAKKATGRDLVIAGDLKLEISLSPAIAVEGVTFANASWGSRPEMAKLGRLAAEVQLIPLLSGTLVVERLVLVGLDLLAETDKKGRGNWEFGAATAEKAPKEAAAPSGDAGPGVLPVVKMVHIEDVKVTYLDGKTGESIKLVLNSLELGADSADSPLRISLDGAFNTVAYKASGQLGAISALLAGKSYPVSLKAEALGAALGIDGAIAEPMKGKGIDLAITVKGAELTDTVTAAAAIVPALKEIALPSIGSFDIAVRIAGSPDKMTVSGIKVSVGKAEQVLVSAMGKVADPLNAKGIDIAFSVEGKDIKPFEKTAGAELPQLPPFKVAGRLSDGGGGYAVDGLNLGIGGSDLSGKLAVALSGKRPKVSADLSSKLLDLDKLLPKGGEKAAPATAKESKGDRVFPDDPLPLDGLKAADADIKFKGKRVVIQGHDISDIDVNLNLANGRLEVKPFGLVVSGGKIGGGVLLDASRSTPPLEITLNARQIDYGALLVKMGQDNIATGKVDMDIALKGAGNSVRAIMASLNGKTRIVTEGGKIKSGLLNIASADVLSALPMVDSKGDKDIKCGVVDFAIKSGQAEAKAIIFETGGLSLVGKGGLNLADETLGLKFDPRAKKVSLMKLAMVPLNVTGTLASPSVMPDVGAAAMGAVTGAVSTVTGIGGGIASGIGSMVGVGGSSSSSQQADETDYCKLALAGKPLVPQKTSAPVAKTAPAAKTAPEEKPSVVEEATKGVTDSVGGIVKGIGGIFGGK